MTVIQHKQMAGFIFSLAIDCSASQPWVVQGEWGGWQVIAEVQSIKKAWKLNTRIDTTLLGENVQLQCHKNEHTKKKKTEYFFPLFIICLEHVNCNQNQVFESCAITFVYINILITLYKKEAFVAMKTVVQVKSFRSSLFLFCIYSLLSPLQHIKCICVGFNFIV